MTKLALSACRIALVLFGLAIGLAISPPCAVAGEEYLLGPQDKVRLKIYEWRASRDVIFEWTALNDVFAVGADGSLSLPFVGTVRAEGLTPEALAGTIAQSLVRHMGLGHAPDVAVEIVQFRPFYIVGHVMQPGEYPYRPGLSVLQAVGIAGGLRTREESIPRLKREVIAGRGDLSLLALSRITLLARKARLQAELADTEEIVFPPELAASVGDGAVEVMEEQERAVFEARRNGLKMQIRALTELRGFLERETESLEKRLGFLDGQIESVKEELASVTTLVDHGLAVAPRQLALERALLQVQSDRLAAETGLLRAQQETSRTEISLVELRSSRASEVAKDLRETETQLNEVLRRMDTALLLLHDSESMGPRLLAMRADDARAEPTYTIVRPNSDGTIELAVGEASRIQPGDTIQVEVPLPNEITLPDAAASAVTGSLAPAALPVADRAPTKVR